MAQLKAVTAGTRKEKRSPNVGILESSLARLYGDLSAAAHVSSDDFVRTVTEYDVTGDDLPGPTSGTRYFPEFIEELARRSFGLHLSLLFHLIEELNIDLLERADDENFTEKWRRSILLYNWCKWRAWSRSANHSGRFLRSRPTLCSHSASGHFDRSIATCFAGVPGDA